MVVLVFSSPTAVSFCQYTEEERATHVLQSVSKYLTLLIEIHPINNVRVLKAVDSCVRVQVIQKSGQLPRAKVVDDLVWAQWDMMEQRLFYIVPKESKSTLRCVQFYPEENFNSILESHLDIAVNDTKLK